jgi:hypothetical protein
MQNPESAQALPPHIRLIQMGRAHVVSRTVYAAAKLGLADQLASGPKSAAELASAMQVHAPSLHRLMRTLASLGVLTERPEQRFALTSLGEALKTNAPGSARASVIFSGSPSSQSGWDNVVYSIETGKPGFEKAQGVAFFDYLAHHPEDASLFSEMMVGIHNQEPPAVAAARRRRSDRQHAGGRPFPSCRAARHSVRPTACCDGCIDFACRQRRE